MLAVVEEPQENTALLPKITNLLSALSRCDSIESIAAVCCERGREAVSADGVSFVLLDESHAYYIEEDSVEIFLKGARPSLEDCICGWCLNNNKPALVDDVFDDSRIQTNYYRGSFVKSLAMIPIKSESGPIGALGFYFAENSSFPDQRIARMEFIAEAAGFALKNVAILNSIETVVAERTDALERVNQELETFAYTVSHDLKNPLSVIKTNCWTILNLMAEECPDKALECVGRMDNAAERMKGQIDGMLEMYRMTNEAFDLEDINLSEIAKVIVADLQNRDSDRIIDFKIESDMHAYGDSRTITVLIENLFSNAWKFSAEAERARIEFFSTNTDSDGLVFVIRDNGVGFTDEEALSLFKVFRRLPDVSHIDGHGIGLTSVRRIINKHGGRVWAEGEKGKGASFYFTLPLLPMDTDLEEFIEEQGEK